MTDADHHDDVLPGDADNGDYKVGYRNPPRQHRFQPGNQAARKKRKPAEQTVSLAETIRKVFARKVKVKRGEKFVNLDLAEVFSERLAQMIVRGTPKEMIAIMTLVQQYTPDLLKLDAQTLRVIYQAAEGSTVPLPPVDLYIRDETK